MHEALGNLLLCGIFISLTATVCFLLAGEVAPEKIP